MFNYDVFQLHFFTEMFDLHPSHYDTKAGPTLSQQYKKNKWPDFSIDVPGRPNPLQVRIIGLFPQGMDFGGTILLEAFFDDDGAVAPLLLSVADNDGKYLDHDMQIHRITTLEKMRDIGLNETSTLNTKKLLDMGKAFFESFSKKHDLRLETIQLLHRLEDDTHGIIPLDISGPAGDVEYNLDMMRFIYLEVDKKSGSVSVIDNFYDTDSDNVIQTAMGRTAKSNHHMCGAWRQNIKTIGTFKAMPSADDIIDYKAALEEWFFSNDLGEDLDMPVYSDHWRRTIPLCFHRGDEASFFRQLIALANLLRFAAGRSLHRGNDLTRRITGRFDEGDGVIEKSCRDFLYSLAEMMAEEGYCPEFIGPYRQFIDQIAALLGQQYDFTYFTHLVTDHNADPYRAPGHWTLKNINPLSDRYYSEIGNFNAMDVINNNRIIMTLINTEQDDQKRADMKDQLSKLNEMISHDQ